MGACRGRSESWRGCEWEVEEREGWAVRRVVQAPREWRGTEEATAERGAAAAAMVVVMG